MKLNPIDKSEQPRDSVKIDRNLIPGGTANALRNRHDWARILSGMGGEAIRQIYGNAVLVVATHEDLVNGDGVVNPDALGAAELIEEYLIGRQGQPVLIANLFTRDKSTGSYVALQGYAGTLADTENLLGTIPRSGRTSARGGILTPGDNYTIEFGAECDVEGAYEAAFGTEKCFRKGEGIIPISDHVIKTGVQRWYEEDNPSISEVQIILAGPDIVPWIKETFGTGDAGYNLYKLLVRAISQSGETLSTLPNVNALEYLVDRREDDFAFRAFREQTVLRSARENLQEHALIISRLQRKIDEEQERMNLLLANYAETPVLSGLAMVTGGSYPIPVFGNVDGPNGPQLKERIRALDYELGAVDPVRAVYELKRY